MYFSYGELEAVCLTGRRRHRIGWFGRVILQVEVKHPRPNYPKAPRPGPYDPWANGFFTFWRDATVADLPELIEPTSEQIGSVA
jgi:hypothetical protein